ncbi:MAG: glycoside hydrolase family 44 protein [Candidatus Kryptoniota bacterium]
MLPIFAHSQSVNFTISTDSLRPISPYIYGTNQLFDGLNGGENWTALRLGGNRMTGYNWENNASNAGTDYYNESDDYMTAIFGIPYSRENDPAIVIDTVHGQALQLGAYTLTTLQMAGFVAKDKSGQVSSAETAPSPRWAYEKPSKGSTFSLKPDTTDDTVFMDECVNFLVNQYGAANSARGIQGYDLDNEPALWPTTHPRIHPLQPTCQELIQKSVALATSVKNVDPSAEIFGPVAYGFSSYYNFQGAADWPSDSAGYSWFLDYYLAQMKKASNTAGKRLLDVLDLHWYPEAQGSDGNRITDTGATTTADKIARVQAPRTLWDSSYTENSWIADGFPSYLPLIPKLMKSINKYYPGTKLSFSEFEYGGESDISGALAIDDVLGIFGKYGVYLATYWQGSSSSPYISAAYKMYRNYDGNNSTFGDNYIPSQSNDTDCSVYGSIKNSNGEIHLIVINKNFSKSFTGDFSIASSKKILSGSVWSLNQRSTQINAIGSISSISDNSFSYTLDPATIYHMVLQTSSATNVTEKNGAPDKFQISAYPNPFNPTCNIEYNIPDNSISRLEIYSVTGTLIRSFGHLSRSGSIIWNGTNGNNQKVASGAYFAILRSADHMFASEKLLLLK